MAHIQIDHFARLLRALPPEFLEKSIDQLLEAQQEVRPDYWLTPITAAMAADFLGTTVDALSQRRARGEGPPWSKIDSKVVYPSRLELLRWLQSKHEWRN